MITNGRVKELLKQAECVVEGDGYGDGNIELLIRLVVKECVNISDEVSMDDTIGYALLEHFGVEE
jgi:hypothetical protein